MILSKQFAAFNKAIFEKKIQTPALTLFILTCVMLASCSNPNQRSHDLSGHLLVAGSTALQPLVTDAAKMFMKQYPHVQIDVRGGGSYVGLNTVTSSDPKTKSDIGDSDIYGDPAVYPDPNLTDHLVCVIPFAMVVNPDITITSLSRDQLVAIFSSGTITNWSEVGGPNEPIIPIARTPLSGTRATFRRYIMGGLDEIGNIKTIDSSQDVLKAVASTRGAISYLALSVADPTVRVLQIDGVSSSQANITSGHYPFWGFEHMYTLGDDNPLIKAFLDFMFSQAVQVHARVLNYIPIADMQSSIGSTFDRGNGTSLAFSGEGEVREQL